VQGAIALALVFAGAWRREGFEQMIGYTAPVFWFFFLLTGVALFILRRREPEHARPFRVPLYPLPPLLFCFSSAYMLWSSVNYYGNYSLVGIGVLLVGVPVLIYAEQAAKKR
jgi:amino acid transporter